jgi:hypothetical protein
MHIPTYIHIVIKGKTLKHKVDSLGLALGICRVSRLGVVIELSSHFFLGWLLRELDRFISYCDATNASMNHDSGEKSTNYLGQSLTEYS